MDLAGGLAVPLVAAMLLASGVLVNEWSGGTMSEAMGLGHHHMFHDDPGVCDGGDGTHAGPGDHEADGAHGPDHQNPHTHHGPDRDRHRDHDHCHHHAGSGHQSSPSNRTEGGGP